MVFIKRSIAKLELSGEEEPGWLKQGEASTEDTSAQDQKSNEQDEDEKESD